MPTPRTTPRGGSRSPPACASGSPALVMEMGGANSFDGGAGTVRIIPQHRAQPG